MELFVDLIEITRIPYRELETVYLSANLAIIPYGHHTQTKMTNGNKSVKFTPHKFSFLVDPIPSNSESSLVITVFTHLTNSHKMAISYVSIPINSIPLHSISTAYLSTTPLVSFSASPIVTISLKFNVNNISTNPSQFKHPSALSGIDYTLCEDAPKIEFDCFGQLKPPQHYIDKCVDLIEGNSDFFLNLISNDSLRNFVLKKVFDRYQVNDWVSISNISSGGQQPTSPSMANQIFSAPSKKPKKIYANKPHGKNCELPPQPPNEQPPNPRRQIRNDDTSDIPTVDNNISNQAWRQQQQAYMAHQNAPVNSELNNEPYPVKSPVLASSMSSKKQFQQPKQNQAQQQFAFVSQQQQQNQQIYQNPQMPQVPQITQISQNARKNESPPKSFGHSVAPDPKKGLFHEIQKPLIKRKGNEHEKVPVRGLLQPKIGSASDDKGPINQTNKKFVCVAPKQKQKYQNQDDIHNYNNNNEMYETSSNNTVSFNFSTSDGISSSQGQPNSIGNGSNVAIHDYRSQFTPMMKPQQPNDNGLSPRRQTPR